MNIGAMSVVLSQANVKQQASLSVMDKAMNQAEANGQGLIRMLEQSNVQVMEKSVTPHIGSSIDIKA